MSIPWPDIPIFLEVARCGTLSSAAKSLKLDRTTVSRRIESMESKLGYKLFDRKDGGFVLSQIGLQAFAAAESAEHELSEFRLLHESVSHSSGRLRVSMSEHLLMTLTECFKAFAIANPDILLELTATDRAVDLQRFEADVVLRLTRGSLSKVESKYIGKPIFSLYHKVGEELSDSHYIARPSEKSVPKFVLPYLSDKPIIISVDGLVSMREIIASGAGVGILPNYFGDGDGRIERCSGPMPTIGFSLYIAFLPEQRRLHRLKTFVDFVELYLRKLEGFQ